MGGVSGMQALPIYDKLAVTIDIGGGSTEIVLGQAARPLFTASMRLGSQRLQVPPSRTALHLPLCRIN